MLRLFWRCSVLVGLMCLLCLCGASRAENLRKDAPSAPQHYFLPENLRKDYAAQRVVRVGWFDQHAVFKEDGGKVCGYAPALLEAISRYTGWGFEWIPIPFEELADKLNNSDIDISCGMSYTPERAQQMTFSKLQAGFEITTLHVPQQSNVHFMDFKDFDGMRLGFYSGAYDQDIFRRMGRQFGFDFTIVEFDESLPMLRAVQDGSLPIPQADLDLGLDVEAALNRLSSEDRLLVSLHLNGGLRFRECAHLLGIPLGTALRRYHTAIGRVRDYLNG